MLKSLKHKHFDVCIFCCPEMIGIYMSHIGTRWIVSQDTNIHITSIWMLIYLDDVPEGHLDVPVLAPDVKILGRQMRRFNRFGGGGIRMLGQKGVRIGRYRHLDVWYVDRQMYDKKKPNASKTFLHYQMLQINSKLSSSSQVKYVSSYVRYKIIIVEITLGTFFCGNVTISEVSSM